MFFPTTQLISVFPDRTVIDGGSAGGGVVGNPGSFSLILEYSSSISLARPASIGAQPTLSTIANSAAAAMIAFGNFRNVFIYCRLRVYNAFQTKKSQDLFHQGQRLYVQYRITAAIMLMFQYQDGFGDAMYSGSEKPKAHSRGFP